MANSPLEPIKVGDLVQSRETLKIRLIDTQLEASNLNNPHVRADFKLIDKNFDYERHNKLLAKRKSYE